MLTGLSLPQLAGLLVAGVLLDLLLGEPRRWHPLTGFGNVATRIELALNRGGRRWVRGALAWTLAVLPLAALSWWAAEHAGLWLHAVLLVACIGLRSLRDHAMPIVDALRAGDLATARTRTSWIVSRDTQDALEPDLAKAGAESLLENGNDAVFGTLFWFMVAGGAGAVLFRLANTLDAMWGYRNERFMLFGRTAARIDDVLNYVPARLTALSYVLLAGTARGRAWRCWRTQAPTWSSPNAGPVMASGAGALGVSLGGAAVYEGQVEQRPPLGTGPAATAADIVRAWRLVLDTTFLWLVLACGAAVIAIVAAPHA
ncbi:adenosylcobinamide-phosphate synthase CbiB [Massilia yuzhufengensis]|uniref:Cobalamin biosynthesis protein CobD n=1 Tax=Massilia yuzhufengensis TaxID=1164594 RepID=A0A1I1WX62_9BURK|nr:adenosylcobinamide-phosphate synthase CbiB [Massilia yuzhufengensis]SFD97660.1 adenosylcobinamide-phosphate synthase [Massilia yuzhufengensis]